MQIIEQIDNDLKEAVKAKNEPVVSSLRMARSAFKNKQIELGRELNEEEIAAILRTMVKQYRDALVDFTNAARTDLAVKQAAEIELLERYLPAGLTSTEIEAMTSKIITESQSTAKDFGKVMGLVMKEVAGRADGNTVREVVQRLLK